MLTESYRRGFNLGFLMGSDSSKYRDGDEYSITGKAPDGLAPGEYTIGFWVGYQTGASHGSE